MTDHPTLTEASTPGGLTRLTVRNQAATAVLYTQGAHITSFVPQGERDLLWVSEDEDYQAGKAIRGGVPVCWPWFGAHPTDSDAPAHGLVRNREWQWEIQSDQPNQTRLRLTLDTSGDHPVFPYRARVEMIVEIGAILTQRLVTHNLDSRAFTVSQALHTYLPVHTLASAEVTGLAGSLYLDKLTGERTQWQEDFRFDREIDRIVLDNDRPIRLTDGAERAILLERTGSHSLIVWNPWVEKSRRLSNFRNDDYTRMVCLETANVDRDARTVEPGDHHELSLTLRDDTPDPTMKHLNLPPRLLDAVADLIGRHPGGMSEFELMQQLDKHYPDVFPKPDLRDPLLLFQHHFVLMHILYRLQDDWWQAGKGVLDINALRIVRRPVVDRGEQQLSVDRSLKDYYLDWENLGRESTDSVQSLLDGFWKRLLGDQQAPEALAELGLDDNADMPAIKARYRQLASEHHPDKGGDPEEFRRIREAYEALVNGSR